MSKLKCVCCGGYNGDHQPGCRRREVIEVTEKCLTKTCNRFNAPAQGRGLCLVCYSKAKKMVDARKTTWDELASLGLALPDVDTSDPFTKAFAEAKRSKDAQAIAAATMRDNQSNVEGR